MSNNTWHETAKAFAPGIPALDRLVSEKPGRNQENTAVPSIPVATGLAAASYRLKNGFSVSLQAPFTKPQDLHSVICYLHACRIEALAGIVRARWLCGHHMVDCPDLLVWTRALLQKRILKSDPLIKLRHIGLNRNTEKLKEELSESEDILRTIVCQQSHDITKFCEDLTSRISPFMIVIDLTPFGYRTSPEELISHLEVYFSNTPMLLMATSGDASMTRFFHDLGSHRNIPTWSTGLLDKSPWSKGKDNRKWQAKIALLPDNRLNDRLADAAYKCRVLHRLLPKHYHEAASYPLYTVYNGLLSLSVPIDFYEMQGDIYRKGGLFPSKPLKDWLSKARRAKLPTGETQSALEEACDALQALLDFLKEGRTGKDQALTKWADQVISKSKSGIVVVGNEREAKIVRSWLLSKYSRYLVSGALSVLGAKSAREAYRIGDPKDAVLIVGKITESETWVATLGSEITWLSYPFEKSWILRMSRGAMLAGKTPDTGKEEWWWLRKITSEPILDKMPEMPEEEWSDCKGQYVSHKRLTIDLPENTNWMEELFADLDWKDDSLVRDIGLTNEHGDVNIRTDVEFYRYDHYARLDVLIEKNGEPQIENKPVQEIQPGDRLVLLLGEDRRQFSLLDVLLEHIAGNSQEVQTYQMAGSRWLDYLDWAARRNGGISGLQKKMAAAGEKVTAHRLEGWILREHTPTSRSKIIPLLAKLSGIEHTSKDTDIIIKSLGKIHGLHTQTGKAIKSMIRARAEGADEVKAFGRSIPIEILDSMLSIEEVQAVSMKEEVQDDLEEGLFEVIVHLIEDSDGKLLITPQGKNSLKESVYKDIDRVVKCIQIMESSLYDVYANGMSMQTAVDELKAENIDFKGGTSPVTQGKYREYERRYKRNRVDIGKHLGIGDSRSPERCFRLHFHWDEEARALVIHHAGRHLRTSMG